MDNRKRDLVDQLVEQLARRGMNPRREVRTAGGVADIVTDAAVYEVTAVLAADALRAATDRMVACRQALRRKIEPLSRQPGSELRRRRIEMGFRNPLWAGIVLVGFGAYWLITAPPFSGWFWFGAILLVFGIGVFVSIVLGMRRG